MRRLNLALLASLSLCRARYHGFSIHDDFVAYPQFEVVFSESPISEQEAHALLDGTNTHPAYSPRFSWPLDLANSIREATSANDRNADSDVKVSEMYEVMNLAPSKYLCSIPILQPPTAENRTVNELAQAEETKELARASTRGWELLNDLDGSCLYYMSGWWSYSFCYNREVVQFHALPTIPNGAPPVRDPHTAEYVLGRSPEVPSGRRRPPTVENASPTTELQTKGDQRYLVKRLDGGTICDLTGKERTIEVQYHCVPGTKGDRIGWIKEVTTCAYLMVVNTPRLCNDVAFLPPKEEKANPITCRLMLPSDDPAMLAEWDLKKTLEARAAMTKGEAAKEVAANGKAEDQATCKDPNATPYEGVSVGGVVVGGRNVLAHGDEEGKPPTRLAPPRSPNVEIIARARSKAEGGKMEAMSREELKELDLNPELVDEMTRELRKLAGDHGWKLEVVEAPGDPREIRGIVDTNPDGEDEHKDKDKEGSEEKFFKEEL